MPALYKNLGREMHVLWKYETIHQKKEKPEKNPITKMLQFFRELSH